MKIPTFTLESLLPFWSAKSHEINGELDALGSPAARDFLLTAKVLQSACVLFLCCLAQEHRGSRSPPRVCMPSSYQWQQNHAGMEGENETQRPSGSQRKRMCSESLWKLNCQLELNKGIGSFKPLLPYISMFEYRSWSRGSYASLW